MRAIASSSTIAHAHTIDDISGVRTPIRSAIETNNAPAKAGGVRTASAIRTVHGGRKRMPPEIAFELVEHRAENALSGREIEVFRQLEALGTATK